MPTVPCCPSCSSSVVAFDVKAGAKIARCRACGWHGQPAAVKRRPLLEAA